MWLVVGGGGWWLVLSAANLTETSVTYDELVMDHPLLLAARPRLGRYEDRSAGHSYTVLVNGADGAEGWFAISRG